MPTDNMGRKVVITRYNDNILSMLFENNRETAIGLYEPGKPSIGSIYVGRVRDIVPDINAAFIEIGRDNVCYYSLTDNPAPIYLNIKNNDRLCRGDLILAELQKEAAKTKAPVVTGKITITGRYAVLDSTVCGHCSVSRKITDKNRVSELRELGEQYMCDNYSFIMRTECSDAENTDITACLAKLTDKYGEIIEKAKHGKCGELLYEPEPDIMRDIYSYGLTDEDEIVTDIRTIYDMVSGTCKANVRYYEDRFVPLIKLYSMESRLEAATRRIVWLKSGGYLVIEPTEALTVIDVNTGKTEPKSAGREEVFHKTNIEACHEIARQLVLRNISGIIIVDFINQKNREYRDDTERTMKALLAKDRVPASFVDFTKLDLMEITRKKIKKPLYEMLNK